MTRREASHRWAAAFLAACWLALTAAGVSVVLSGRTSLVLKNVAVLLAFAALACGLQAWINHREFTRSRARRRRLRELVRNEADGALVCRGEWVVAANDAARTLLSPAGGSAGSLEGASLASVLPGWTVDRIPRAGDVDGPATGAGTASGLRLSRRTAQLDERRYTVVSIRNQNDAGSHAEAWAALAERFNSLEPRPFGLLLLALDRAGPAVEDELVRRVGARLGAGPGGVRLVARWSRDRFALLVDEDDPARLRALGASLEEVLTEWLRTDGRAPDVRARAGAALAFVHAASPGALVDAAERALLRNETVGLAS